MGVADIADGYDGEGQVAADAVSLASYYDNLCVLCYFGVIALEDLQCVNEVSESFSLVCDALASKEQEFAFERQAELFPCCCLVERAKLFCVDGIGYADDLMSLGEGRGACEVGHPLAASDECHFGVFVYVLFLVEELAGKVAEGCAVHESAVVAVGGVLVAVA